MRYSTRDLLTLLISLFILNSCTNPSGIGLDANPGDDFYGILTDTVTLQTITVRDDSMSTAPVAGNSSTNIPAISINQIPFGYFKDPILGETRADIAFDLTPADTDIRIPVNAEIDSAVFVLRYGNTFVGDSVSSTYQVEVKQLDEVYGTTTAYYATKQWAVKPDVLGSAQIHKFHLNDSVTIHLLSSTGGDSTTKVAPQMRIKLDNATIKNLLNPELDSATVNSESGFRQFIKGLYLTTNTAEQQGVGGLTTLVNDALNGMEVHYHTTASDNTKDTVSLRFPVLVAANVGYASTMSPSLNRTFSTAVQAALTDTLQNQTRVYTQSLGGLRMRIDLPYLDQLKGRKIAINKAELVVYADDDNSGNISPAPRLTLYRKDLAGVNQPIPDGDSRPSPDLRSQYSIAGPNALGGFYDDKQKRYVFFVTSYIQDVLLGKLNNSSLYLAPAHQNLPAIPYWPDINTPARAVLKGYNPQDVLNGKEARTKLNIYYTELD